MIDIPEERCRGCLACVAVCESRAISVGKTGEGFYFPQTDETKCIKCEKCNSACEKRCAEERNVPVEVYSLQALDKNILIGATSGGAFELLAREILNENGVVFGVVYDENMIAVHKAAHTVEDIKKMNGSKYVQSNPLNSYIEAKRFLQKGKKVLFSGTPCQISALLKVTERHENLITVDIPCYGVPSPEFFASQVSFLEKKYKGKMTDFHFRDKRKNGFSHTTVIVFENKKGEFSKTIDEYDRVPYHHAFGKRNFFQKSCYNCDYTSVERVADITLGSFWDVDTITDMYDVSEGVSMVLANTLVGSDYVHRILNKSKFVSHSLADAEKANHALVECVRYPEDRDEIGKTFAEQGFAGIVPYYKEPLKSKIKRLIPKTIVEKIVDFKKRKRG